ncbi:hypothetical protein LCGC14_2193580 [marine sediment metagenome]|uniref:HNH nuclease domain-containing protein n=1 Tax=marine sediment metagenome TaxID=412755 RepID=A0A0F9FW91_9ZZZZ
MPYKSIEDERRYHREWARKHYVPVADLSSDAHQARLEAHRHYKKRNLEARRKYYRKLRQDVLTAYGRICVCCGELHEEFLTMDHINGGGRKERKKYSGGGFYASLRSRGFPKDDYRLLCMNCNLSFGRYGYCPHKSLQEKKPVV